VPVLHTSTMRAPRFLIATLCLLAGATAFSQTPAPTKTNVPYGEHEKQVLDFYQAKAEGATPLLFFVHGGG